MKREELKKLLGENATDETVDAIMAMNGKDIEANKTQLADLTKQLETAGTQLADANKQIESFKGMDVEGVKKSADEWKTKFEQAQEETKTQLAAIKFDHALEGALTTAKARNPKAVRALLQTDLLKLADDGSVSGLKEQLEKIQADNDYLFESEETTPRIVAGGNNQPVITDAFEAALLRGAGIEAPKK